MTNQNVMVPETIAITTATAANHTVLLPYPPPKDVGDGFSILRKCLPLPGTGGRINVLLESMKALSPTHPIAGAAHSDSDRDEHLIWAKRHPSALKMFEEIMRASAGRQIVMFLDYDGTLTPIVGDPDRAFMSDAMRDTVREVARYFPTAIVSGRCRNKVYNFVRLAELYYAGSHGMDIKVPAKGANFKKSNGKSIIFQPATKFLPMVDKVYKTLLETTKCIPGSKIENNKFCVSVHFRCVDEKQWSGLADQVKLVLREYPKLRLTPGRKVLEIRPTIKWDKGMAMEFLLESLGFSNSNDVLPIYIGDDRTDEDAFKALRNRGSQGVGILVSKFPKETSASYSLQDPSEEVLAALDFDTKKSVGHIPVAKEFLVPEKGWLELIRQPMLLLQASCRETSQGRSRSSKGSQCYCRAMGSDDRPIAAAHRLLPSLRAINAGLL